MDEAMNSQTCRQPVRYMDKQKLVDYKANGQTYERASYSVSDRIEGPAYLAVDQQTD